MYQKNRKISNTWKIAVVIITFEPRHGKTNRMRVCTQRRLRSARAFAQSHQSSLSAWRKLGSLATHWAHSEDWSDWADAQADPSLRWADTHFVGFCHVMAHNIWIMWLYYRVMSPKDADRMANSVDPLGAVWTGSGSTLFAQTCLFQN